LLTGETQLPHTIVTTAIEREEEAEIINFCSPHARQPALLTETTQLPDIM